MAPALMLFRFGIIRPVIIIEVYGVPLPAVGTLGERKAVGGRDGTVRKSVGEFL